MNERLRIINRRLDGTKSTEPPSQTVDRIIPFPRGKDLIVTVLNDDGSESPLPPYRSIKLICDGRNKPLIAQVEFYNVDLVVECVCDVMQAPGVPPNRGLPCDAEHPDEG